MHAVTEVGEARPVARRDVCVLQGARHHAVGVGDGRVVEVAAHDDGVLAVGPDKLVHAVGLNGALGVVGAELAQQGEELELRLSLLHAPAAAHDVGVVGHLGRREAVALQVAAQHEYRVALGEPDIIGLRSIRAALEGETLVADYGEAREAAHCRGRLIDAVDHHILVACAEALLDVLPVRSPVIALLQADDVGLGTHDIVYDGALLGALLGGAVKVCHIVGHDLDAVLRRLLGKVDGTVGTHVADAAEEAQDRHDGIAAAEDAPEDEHHGVGHGEDGEQQRHHAIPAEARGRDMAEYARHPHQQHRDDGDTHGDDGEDRLNVPVHPCYSCRRASASPPR